MDIILDSNIYRGDFLLRSNDFDVLLDYLKRTDSSVYFPQIVLDELKELHKRALMARISNLKKSIKNLKLVLTDEKQIESLKLLDIDKESDLYIEFVKNKLKIKDRNILPSRDSYLSEVTSRAIKREKPCSEDGQGFRDAIIWLTLRDYCLKLREKQITFISNNDKDFANGDKTNLHDSLLKECESLGIKINYFKTVRDFIEKQSVKIDFISEKWIWDSLSLDSFNDYLIDYLNSNRSTPLAETISLRTNYDCSGYCKATNANTHSIHNFYVYEMLDGSFIVNITFECEIEIEFEFYDYRYDTHDLQLGYGMRFYNHTQEIFNSEIYASLTIENNEITNYEIDDLYI